MLNCEKELTLIPGATHLLEEPGAVPQAGLCSIYSILGMKNIEAASLIMNVW